ncbi:MAG: cyclase family protein [Eubacteriaceae bacterium]|jgi:arylformamidase|nr:cyclase family protein [Eubacteriaceae bacterium]
MKSFQVFDLSQPTYHNCPAWPTFAYPEIKNEAVVGFDGFTAERLDMNVHTGTHLDAPYHFFADGKTIDQMPLEDFMGEAIIINLADQIQPKQGIDLTHLKPFAEKITAGCIVLLYTGWGEKRSFTEAYYKDWPYVSQEAAEFFVQKQIKGVGTDGMSVGGWYEGTGRPSHEVLLSNNIWALEELFFPKELLAYDTCWLSAVPLKLQGVSGSPTRAYAMIFD